MRRLLPIACVLAACGGNPATADIAPRSGSLEGAEARISTLARPLSGANIVEIDIARPGADGPTAVRVTHFEPEADEEPEGYVVDLDMVDGRAVYQVAFDANTVLGEHRIAFETEEGEAVEATIVVEEDGERTIEVSGIDPLQGQPGTEMVIYGEGLVRHDGGSAVQVGGAAAEILSATETKILALVPADATTGSVTVSNRNGLAVSEVDFNVAAQIALTTDGQRVVRPNGTAKVRAQISGLADKTVIWSASLGAIEPTGDGWAQYTAPAAASPGTEVVLEARSTEEETLVATRALTLGSPVTLVGLGTIPASAGATLVDAKGKASIQIKPGQLEADADFSLLVSPLSAEPWPEGMEETTRPLLEFELDLQGSELDGPVQFHLTLPVQLAEHAELKWSREEDGQWLEKELEATVSADGLGVEGSLATAGRWRLGEEVRVVALPMWASMLSGPLEVDEVPDLPPGRDADPGPGTAIEEGMTLPVVLRGANFWPGHTFVDFEAGKILDAQGNLRAASADALAQLDHATILVPASGDELAFTFRSNPIPELAEGETLLVDLQITRVDTVGNEFDTVTASETLRIRGLDELVVTAGETTLWTLEGEEIHAFVDRSRRYSTVVVEPGARLGIGRPLSAIAEIEGVTVDLSSMQKFQAEFGLINWLLQAAQTLAPLPNGDEFSSVEEVVQFSQDNQFFHPMADVVELDVTGPVVIDGEVYMEGMHGGERIRLGDNPGKGRLGGLLAHWDSATNQFITRPSGGIGGAGGVTQNSTTFPGNQAVSAGYDHEANVVQGVGSATGGREMDEQLYDAAQWATELQGAAAIGKGLYEGGAALLSFNPFALASAVGTVAGGYSELASPGRSMCFAPECPTGGGACYSYFCPRHGGQGGNAGEFRYGHGRALTLAPNDTWFIGGGGGGGGGGGSSYLEGEAFGFLNIHTNAEIGGGGAGGGGAAGGLRLTSSRSIDIGSTGRIRGTGGRGGMGETQKLYAGPGGGGGGGAAGLLKLQAPVVDNLGSVELTGGVGGGAFLGAGATPIPQPLWPEVLVLDGDNHGGQLVYRRGHLDVDLVYPTGRQRGQVTLPVPGSIGGLANAYMTISNERRTVGVWVLTKQMRLHLFRQPDFGRRSFTPFTPSMPFTDLSNVRDGNGFYVFRHGFEVTDVVQSPVYPHPIFISGYRKSDHWHAKAIIVELTASGSYVATRLAQQSRQGVQRPEGCPVTTDFADAVDVLANGDLVMLGTLEYLNGDITSGVHRIGGGGASVIVDAGSDIRSLSVLRDTDEGDVLGLLWYTCAVNEPPGTINEGLQLRRYRTDGSRVNEIGTYAGTLGWPGEPGFARIDGQTAGSRVPSFSGPQYEIDDLLFEGNPVTYNAAALSGFFQAYNGYAFGDQVTFQDALNAIGVGGDPTRHPDLCVENTSVQCATTGAATDPIGLVFELASIDHGFNRIWFRPDNNDIEELMSRDVYRLESPANPRLLE